MKQGTSQYIAVELRDGTMGNYELAQQYYRDFDRLRIDSPEKFNRICHSVLSENRGWSDEDRNILASAAFPFTRAADNSLKLSRPEQEIRQFIKLAVAPTIVSRMFGILTGDTPDYDLQSPFKNCVWHEPDLVDEKDQHVTRLVWSGTDNCDNPADCLVPDPGAKPPRRDLDTSYVMFPPGT